MLTSLFHCFLSSRQQSSKSRRYRWRRWWCPRYEVWCFFYFEQAVYCKMPIEVTLFFLHRSCRELRRGIKERGKLSIGPSVTAVQDKVSCSTFKLEWQTYHFNTIQWNRDFYIINWLFQIHFWPFSCIYTERWTVYWMLNSYKSYHVASWNTSFDGDGCKN